MRFISSLSAAYLASHFIAPTFAQTAAELAALALFWDYGRSPPVYPTPQGAGTGDWASAYSQAKALVARMSNEEKQNITMGYASTSNGCSGNSYGISRLGFPGMCLQDAGNGVRGMEGVSGYPSGIHVGASWNRDLANSRGYYLGAEFKAKGVNVALGPVVGPLGRVATGGRNWEGVSNDPYLAGALGAETVQGMQQSVITCTKHFIANEQEANRQPGDAFIDYGIDLGFNQSVSENVDDQAMHELYLWPFQDLVRAGTGAVMCSYNRINNSYGCANSKTMNGLLKTELGFQGFVVSDWLAQHTGIASANSGLDLVMPNSFNGTWFSLATAVANGSMAQTRLDDMATRILASWYKLAPFTNPGFGVPLSVSAPHSFVNARTAASAPTILQGAMEGQVLVKNIRNALPLKSPQFLSLFGYDGRAPLIQNPPDAGFATGTESTNIGSAALSVALGAVPPPNIALNGTLWVGGGSGANTPPFVIDPFQAFTTQAMADNTWLAWDFQSALPTVDPASDGCIVFINAYSTEGGDRPALSDDYSDDLVNHVASQCTNTMVVIHNAGIRIVDAFYDNPNVTAIIYAHLPGQQSGTALVNLMYGKTSFSGRLPYTVAKQESDYGNLLYPTRADATSNYYTQSNFTEGVYIDYKHFIKNSIQPRFAFGFGLTYSSFRYSNIAVSFPSSTNLTRLPASAAIVSGGNPRLFDTVATVTVNVHNGGNVAAAEVAQLYVGVPNGPAKVLRGFQKQLINPGMDVQFSFALTRRDLSTWNTVEQQWVLQSGNYQFKIGKSVLDIVEKQSMKITTT